MKKLLSWMLIWTLLMGTLIIPAVSSADQLYVIPDSDKRELTYEELWEYQADTLLYAFNEIYARHGYKFETGSRCYNWFTQMPWYSPNMEESSTNHSPTYSQCSTIENHNVDLIKKVRKDMRAMHTTNPNGKGMPTPPAQNVNKPRGFEWVNLQSGQKLPVYSAPSTSAYRANGGKATVSTNGAVYGLGWDNGWMLMLYEANHVGQYRVGYIQGSSIKGTLPNLDMLTWAYEPCQVLTSTNLTDDPALTGNPMTFLQAGTQVTYLTTMYNNTGWDYIETSIDGQTARGFVPSGTLDLDYLDQSEKE